MNPFDAVRRQTADAVRLHLIERMRRYLPPSEWLEAEADVLDLTSIQLSGYCDLLARGEHRFNALNLMSRVPDVHVHDCVRRVTPHIGRPI